MQKIQAKNIDDYIASFSGETAKRLKEMRDAIRKAAPDAEEAIAYAVPTFRLYGNLVHFAAFKNHIGFYPGPSGIDAFKKDLAAYEGAKGSVQFRYDETLPLPLIAKIVRFRVKENTAKAKEKKPVRRR